MPRTYHVTKEQASEIAKVRKNIRDIATDKRLRAVQLRVEGKSNT